MRYGKSAKPALSSRVPSKHKLKLRALCYDAFAVLHSGVSKTPFFVAERLNRVHLLDASDEKRTNIDFARIYHMGQGLHLSTAKSILSICLTSGETSPS